MKGIVAIVVTATLALGVACDGGGNPVTTVGLFTVVLHSLPENDLPVHIVIGPENVELDDSNRLVPASPERS